MEAPSKKVELFGGAMTVNVPSGYEDVSQIRQVPDHQEVYLSSSGFSSLIFDLGERVSHTTTDEDALRYHFEDIVDDKDTSKIWPINPKSIQLPHLPPNTPALSLLATTKPSPPLPSDMRSGPARPNTATSVTVLLGLIRLVGQKTDIAVTLNIPRMPASEGGEEGEEVEYDDSGKLRLGKAAQEGNKIMEEVWRTLEIRDWSLFGEG